MTTPLAKTLMIDDNAELARWCQHWQSLPFVAVDTEFVRTETFYPIAGLIQVGDGEQAVLIDPLAITDWAPLVALLEAPSVVKVLHACSEEKEERNMQPEALRKNLRAPFETTTAGPRPACSLASHVISSEHISDLRVAPSAGRRASPPPEPAARAGRDA